MATEVRKTVETHAEGQQLLIGFFVVLAVAAIVLVLVFLVNPPVHSIESSASVQRGMDAYAARYSGLAEQHLAMQRGIDAYAARNAGLAEIHASQRSIEAYTARNAGLAAYYNTATSQRANDAYAARLTGLAEHYLGDK